MPTATEPRPRLLLLDDDPDLLEVYREILGQLPSQPEVRTALSGPRAMAMLEAEPFRLLICDLKMPKMDGLQVLSIVRRKFPQLRTVALTSVEDEQFRSRAYALGIDLFWHKPASEEEIRMFLECLESLLGREVEGGFRGIQSKSLIDLIQLECLSQNSAVLRITNAARTGRIWIQNGEVIDAETEDLTGEEAFRRIFEWRTGHFETLPADQTRPRTITKSASGLLLESAQALDESIESATQDGRNDGANLPSPLKRLAEVEGIEFVLAIKPGGTQPQVARGLENPKRIAAWAQTSLTGFRSLGEALQAGPLEHVDAFGPQRHVTLASQGELDFCVGWTPTLSPNQLRNLMKQFLALWTS